MQRHESVFDRLYRVNNRLRNSAQTDGNLPANHRRLRPLLSPQSTQYPNEFYSAPKKLSPSPHKAVTSPPDALSTPEGSRSPQSKPHNDWSVTSPSPRSHTQGSLSAPVFQPPSIRKRRQNMHAEQCVVAKTQKPTICKEDTKTWENLTAKTCELADADNASESLNDLISQLIEEQSISPTDTILNENVISWKTLIASLTEEAQSSANITKVQEIYDKLVADHVGKSLDEIRNYGRAPQVCHSVKQVRQKLSDQEYESAVLFDASIADAVLIEPDSDASTLPNLTTMVDQAIDSGGQEASSSLDTQLAFSSLPPKDSTDHENTSIKGDRDENEIQAIIASPKFAEMSVAKMRGEAGSKQDWGDSAKSNLIESFKNQVVVGSAVLMMSCIGIIEPFGENSFPIGPRDFALLPPLSEKSTTGQSSDDSEHDFSIDETLVSLNSVRENIQQEHVEALRQNKTETSTHEGMVESRPQSGLFEKRSSIEEIYQSSVHQSPEHRQSDSVALLNSEVGFKETTQNPNVEQGTLNESYDKFPSVSLGGGESSKLHEADFDFDLENKHTTSATENYSIALDEKLSTQLKVNIFLLLLFH